MFENFPKKRIELPDEYKAIYNTHYRSNRDGSTLASSIAQHLEKWMHLKVADDVDYKHTSKTLEIGAGTLNQLAYEIPRVFDIIEPFKQLYEHSEMINYVRNIYSDIGEVDKSLKYDRIISIAVFEHILDLPKVVANSCLLLKNNGVLRTAIPNEGQFIWQLGWKCSTSIEFYLKYRLNYEKIMKYEHVNTADEIEEILNYFFEENRCYYNGPTKSLSFYRYYESRKPKIGLANSYLQNINSY